MDSYKITIIINNHRRSIICNIDDLLALGDNNSANPGHIYQPGCKYFLFYHHKNININEKPRN